MKRSGNSVGISRLLPVFDFGLLIVLMTCGTAGFAWISQPTQSGNAATEPAPLPLQPERTQAEVAALQKLVDQLANELKRKEAEANDIQAALEKAGRPNLDATKNRRAVTHHDLETLQQRIARLKETLRQLQEEASRLHQDKGRLAQLQNAIDEVEKQIRQLTEELDQLNRQNKLFQNEINALRATPIDRPTVTIDCDPQFESKSNQESVDLMLWDNVVTPIRSPYYSLVQSNGQTALVLTQQGEHIDRALAPGSNLLRTLNEVDSRKQYVLVFVSPSAFDAFRRLRTLLQERSIPFGWEPTHATNMVSGDGSSGAATRRGVMSGGSRP